MNDLNPRVARSRNKLGDALCSLGLERNYETLSITAITKRAGVGYSTFFRHYATVEELLIDAMRTTMRELGELLQDQESVYDEAVAVFRYVRAHQDRFRFYVSLPDTHPIREVLKEEAVKLVSERYQAAEASSVPLGVSVNHMVESSYAFLKWHLDHINNHEPEQLASIYVDLIVTTAETSVLSPRTGWYKQKTGEEVDRDI